MDAWTEGLSASDNFIEKNIVFKIYLALAGFSNVTYPSFNDVTIDCFVFLYAFFSLSLVALFFFLPSFPSSNFCPVFFI